MKKRIPLLVILLLAFGLRLYRLNDAPPGLTHDEADHAWEGLSVLAGAFRYYFPLGYGREPLYGYTLAGSFALFGKSLLSLRYINILATMLAMAATYRWSKQAFSEKVALFSCGFLAVGFWSLSISRQALRSSLMPLLFMMAVLGLWHILGGKRRGRLSAVILIALSIGISLHNYMSARLTWTIFPIFLLYLLLTNKNSFKQNWKAISTATLLGLALGAPLFIFLRLNPGLESRIGMLLDPLTELLSGNIQPLWANMSAATMAFFLPGRGDTFLAYNLPGRPYYHPITGVLALIGLGLAFWRWQKPQYGFLLIWLGIGLAPSLITGTEAGTTRGIGAFTTVYILPAIGLAWVYRQLAQSKVSRQLMPLTAILMFGIVGTMTWRDYFPRWADRPDVRAAYQHTLINMLDYWENNANIDKSQPTLVSSVFTNPAHNAAIALLLEPKLGQNGLWIDNRLGMIFRGNDQIQLLTSDATPPHPIFAEMLEKVDAVALRVDDLDPNFQLYRLDSNAHESLALAETNVNFNDALTLTHAGWLDDTIPAGAVAEFVTVWHIDDPANVAPPAPPIDLLEVSLFTHIMLDEQNILTQSDRLDAPSWLWRKGDIVVQVHQMYIAPETAAGVYESAVGLYDRNTQVRVPIQNGDTPHDENRAFPAPITITNP